MSDGMPAQENVKSVPALGVPWLVMASAVFAVGNALSIQGVFVIHLTVHSRGIPVSHPEMKPPAIARTSLGDMAISKA